MPISLSDVIQKLRLIQTRLESRLPVQSRQGFRSIDLQLQRAVLLIGPRGVGKTTTMLQRCRGENILYFSADNPLTAPYLLSDLVEAAYMDGYAGVFIDEVHYARNWAQHLKSLYDSFPNQTLWASDSSSIVLRKGLADLSRRFVVRRLPLLSLREFAILKGAPPDLPLLDPTALDFGIVREILKSLPVLRLFREWLSHGMRPIFLEGIETYPEKITNVIEKSIAMDIPFLVPQLNEGHLRFMTAIIGYLAKSSIPTLAVNSLCSEWGVGKEKMYALLSAMEEAQLLRIIRKKNDHKIQSIGAKIFLHDPSAYAALQGDVGSVREALAVAAFQESGRKIQASSNEEEYDFLVDGKWKLEIGGKTKKLKKADFVIRDQLDLPSGNAVPLWTLGFQW